MSSLGIPSVTHKAIRPEKPGPGEPENIQTLARSLKAAYDDVMHSAARAFAEARADQYSYGSTAEGSQEQQKSLSEAHEEFEELCDRMYILLEGARHVLLERVNDTHDAPQEIPVRPDAPKIRTEGDESEADIIKVDAQAVAYTTTAASQVRCAQQTMEVLTGFCADYEKPKLETSHIAGLGGVGVGDIGVAMVGGDPLAAMDMSMDNLGALAAVVGSETQ